MLACLPARRPMDEQLRKGARAYKILAKASKELKNTSAFQNLQAQMSHGKDSRIAL